MPRAVCVDRRSRLPFPPRGFSIIELVIVMGIIATISTIGVFRYAGALERYRVEFAAARVAADLRLAQSTARLRSAASTISFDQSRSRYAIANQFDPYTRTGSMIVQLSQEPTRATISKVTIDGGDDPLAILTFDGYGRPLNRLQLRLQVGSSIRLVTVDPDGGGVSISVP